MSVLRSVHQAIAVRAHRRECVRLRAAVPESRGLEDCERSSQSAHHSPRLCVSINAIHSRLGASTGRDEDRQAVVDRPCQRPADRWPQLRIAGRAHQRVERGSGRVGAPLPKAR